MTFVLIGVNHRSAALELRERLVFPPGSIPSALEQLCGLPLIDEALLLSTCNRTEILVSAQGDGADTVAALKEFVVRERSFDLAELESVLYVEHGVDAVRHLFRLGVGLDSMILGEPQILGQVKEAYDAASRNGSLGSHLHSLLQRSFAVAKRVRTSTEIGRNPVSVSYAAVDLAHKIFGGLEERSILLVGAGETAELTARHLVSNGIRSIYVANRTFNRAEVLAREFGGEAVRYDRLVDYLEKVDILISSTSAPHPVVRYDDAARVIKKRRNRPLFLIDIAVPRDIEPKVNKIDNIFLYDIDDLQHVADAGLEERRVAAERAEQLIDEEVETFERRSRAEEIAPTIVALRDRLHGLRDAEVDRFESRLKDLPPDHRQAIEELTSSLINKVLHGPIRHLKRSASSPEGPDRVAWVRQVFGLQDESGEQAPEKPGESAAEGAAEEVEDVTDVDEVKR